MESTLTRHQAYWALNGLPAIGPVTLNRLLERFGGDPVAVLEASGSALESVQGVGPKVVDTLRKWRSLFDLEKEMARMERLGGSFICREDDRYPEPLKELRDAPIGLYCLGGYDFKKPSIAIVGSRKTTLYGQRIAQEFGAELARIGFCVSSGMARGIDTFAHRGALSASGSTVAVLGNGLDIIYPSENLDLYREIQRDGAVVSEFPFGRRADKQSFPQRNRIVSGLSAAVLVVESDDAGGSMITAKFAGEQGRVVCAIPGRIDQATSRGCHQLIRDGAVLVTSVEDLLSEVQYACQMPSVDRVSRLPDGEGDLSEGDRKLLKLFAGGEALSMHTLCERSGLPVSDTSAAVMLLEINGRIGKRLDGLYEAI